jgi:di/tricarboxylate transporter
MIIAINSGKWGVQIMVVRLDIEIWEIGKGGTKRGVRKRGRWMGDELWGLLSFLALVHVWCISAVVVEGVCVRDCRGLGFCTVDTVGCSFCRFTQAALKPAGGEKW